MKLSDPEVFLKGKGYDAEDAPGAPEDACHESVQRDQVPLKPRHDLGEIAMKSDRQVRFQKFSEWERRIKVVFLTFPRPFVMI